MNWEKRSGWFNYYHRSSTINLFVVHNIVFRQTIEKLVYLSKLSTLHLFTISHSFHLVYTHFGSRTDSGQRTVEKVLTSEYYKHIFSSSVQKFKWTYNVHFSQLSRCQKNSKKILFQQKRSKHCIQTAYVCIVYVYSLRRDL